MGCNLFKSSLLIMNLVKSFLRVHLSQVLFCHQMIQIIWFGLECVSICSVGFPGGSEVKASAWNAGDPSSIPGEGPLEKEMATHFSTLAWRIPWREEPGRLQSTGSQRVRHDGTASLSWLIHIVVQQKLTQHYKAVVFCVLNHSVIPNSLRPHGL